MKRLDKDKYYTPQSLTELLLKHLELPPNSKIIEPCCGDGAIADYLKEQGHKVIASDIDHGSKYDATTEEYWATTKVNYGIHWTITNPPFNQATDILSHALSFSVFGVAMLLRLTYLEPCRNRAKLLQGNADNLRMLIPVNPRPRFRADSKNTDSCTVAWFVWDKSFSWEAQGSRSPFIFAPINN